MNRRCPATLLLAALSLGSVAGTTPAASDAATIATLTAEARAAAGELSGQLAGELAREYAISGRLRSIVVCKYSAPELSSQISRLHGAQVRRVTLRTRNPALGTADEWEQRQLLDFERRHTGGEAVSTLEVAALVDEPAGRYFRFLKAIEAGELCVSCHGTKDALNAATRTRLSSEDPHDRATGYRVGDMLGAVSFKKALAEARP